MIGKNIKITKIIIAALIFFAPINAFSQRNNESTAPKDIIFGAKAGYSFALGYFDNVVNGSGYYGLHVIPFVTKWILIEMDVYYTKYNVKSLNDSTIHSVSMSIGPSFYYSLVPLLELYVGVAVKGNYLYLKGEDSSLDEETYKPGIILKTGFFMPIKWGIRARVGFEYCYNELSKRDFHAINFHGGVSFNYQAYQRTRKTNRTISNSEKISKYFKKGSEELKKGKLDDAKKSFERVLVYDDNHKKSKNNLAIIKKTKNNYHRADFVRSQQLSVFSHQLWFCWNQKADG
jgi:hypothetical protein